MRQRVLWRLTEMEGNMGAALDLSAVDTTIRLDVLLSNAVVLSWSDLMPELTSGLIHVEYHVEPMGSVEYTKVGQQQVAATGA
jgi:hypothetical protein